MPTKIDFRDCVHHGIAGPTPEHILASIRAEYCLAPKLPLANPSNGRAARIEIQAEDFPAVERSLGASAFRQLLSDFRRRPNGEDSLGELPEFLAEHRYGRATAALVDLARLERALAMSEQAPDTRSIGACCLPSSLLRTHPDLTLSLHPAWQWLDLGTPADHWRSALLGRDATLPPPPASRTTRLRVFPDQGRTIARRLEPAEFAFEHALRIGETLRHANDAARAFDASFDPIQGLQPLLTAGAVIDATLHPAQVMSNPTHATTSQHR